MAKKTKKSFDERLTKRLPLQFWIVASIAFINSVSFTIIIPVLYILDGITGGNNSVAQAVVSDITSPEQRTQAFGIYSGLFRLGFVAGPPLSYLAQTVPPIPTMSLWGIPIPAISSLGMSFLVSAAIALIAALMCFFFLSETSTEANEPQDKRRSVTNFDFTGLFTAWGRPVVGRILLMTFLNGFTFTIFTFAFQPFFMNVLGQDAKNLAIAFVAFGLLAFVSQVFALEPLRKRFSIVNAGCRFVWRFVTKI